MPMQICCVGRYGSRYSGFRRLFVIKKRLFLVSTLPVLEVTECWARWKKVKQKTKKKLTTCTVLFVSVYLQKKECVCDKSPSLRDYSAIKVTPWTSLAVGKLILQELHKTGQSLMRSTNERFSNEDMVSVHPRLSYLMKKTNTVQLQSLLAPPSEKWAKLGVFPLEKLVLLKTWAKEHGIRLDQWVQCIHNCITVLSQWTKGNKTLCRWSCEIYNTIHLINDPLIVTRRSLSTLTDPASATK